MSTPRINPDSRAVLVVATVATAALALVSFLLSFNGLSEAAAWANVPSWLAWALPAYVDGAILVYTLAALVFRARGESARLEWAALGVFAALSVAANGVHAWTTAPEGLQVALGVILAALAPVSVVMTTHTIARLVVAPPQSAEGVPTELVEYAKADLDLTRSLFAVETEPEEEEEPADPIAARNAEIRALDGKLSVREIAAKVGVSKSTVSRILNRHPDDDSPAAVAPVA